MNLSDSPQPHGYLPAAQGPLWVEPLRLRIALGWAGWGRAGGWQGVVEYYLYTCTLQSTLSVCLVLADGGRSERKCACQWAGCSSVPQVRDGTLGLERGRGHSGCIHMSVRSGIQPPRARRGLLRHHSQGLSTQESKGHRLGGKPPGALQIWPSGVLNQAGTCLPLLRINYDPQGQGLANPPTHCAPPWPVCCWWTVSAAWCLHSPPSSRTTQH